MGGVLAQLGGDEGVGARARVDCENVLGEQRGEVLACAISGARPALPGEAVQEIRGERRVDAHRVLFRSGYSTTQASTGSSAAVAERNQEARLGPAEDPSREREASKLLAQMRVKGSALHSAWKLSVSAWRISCVGRCRNRLWRTLFLMKKGGQQGWTRGRAPTEEAVMFAPDVSLRQ